MTVQIETNLDIPNLSGKKEPISITVLREKPVL